MAQHNATMKDLQAEIPGVMDAFTKLHEEVLKEGAISVKHKKLMLVAIAVAKRCEFCLQRHLMGAIKEGATRKEIMETAGVGMLMSGGPGVAFSMPNIARILDEMEPGK